MKINNNVTQYEDFKYVMQDTSYVYLGAKYTFQELLDAELVPFKLKAIISHYLLKEVEPENTLESQFYYLEQGTFLYDTLYQLKVKVKAQVQVEQKSIFGKSKIVYKEQVFSLKELTSLNLAKKKASGIIIREIVISKLGMMSFSI